MQEQGTSATIQFLAWLPALFVGGVLVVCVALLAAHFLKMRK